MSSKKDLNDHRAALLAMLHQDSADITQQLSKPRAADIAQFLAELIDEQGHLSGTWSLRQLLIARPSAWVDELMVKDVIHTEVDASQEDVARLVARYNL